MKQVSGSLKLLYSQYRELQTFAQFGSDLDQDTKQRLALGERIVAVLKQDRSSPVSVENQIAIIFATVNGYLNDVEVADIPAYEKGLYKYLDESGDTLMAEIVAQGLTDELKARLEQTLAKYTENFLS